MSLGGRIKSVRKSLKMNQDDFAKRIGVRDKGTVSNWEKDKREPQLEILYTISKLGGVSLDWLVLGSETDKELQSAVIIQLRERIRNLEEQLKKQGEFIALVAERVPEYLGNKKKRQK